MLLSSLGSSVLLCGSQLWPGLCNTPITFHPQLTQQNIDYTNTHATDYCACFNRGPFGPECVFIVDYSCVCVCVCDGLFLHVERSRSLDAPLPVSFGLRRYRLPLALNVRLHVSPLQLEELHGVPASSEKAIAEATARKEELEKQKVKEEEKLKEVMESLKEETSGLQQEKEVRVQLFLAT